MVTACNWLWWRTRSGLIAGSMVASAESGIIRPWSLRTWILSRDCGLRLSFGLALSTTAYWFMSE
ncbi:hypothetical protein RLIN73S_03741 [Rhodanobacter lindaniclasticus]